MWKILADLSVGLTQLVQCIPSMLRISSDDLDMNYNIGINSSKRKDLNYRPASTSIGGHYRPLIKKRPKRALILIHKVWLFGVENEVPGIHHLAVAPYLVVQMRPG